MANLPIILTTVCVIIAVTNSRLVSRRQTLDNAVQFSPHCKFDEETIQDDQKLFEQIRDSELVFSARVISDVAFHESNRTSSFYVFVKRFFKRTVDLKSRYELKVSKTLHPGEGTKCRQVVRYRYTAIFLGRTAVGPEDADVVLGISPVPVTLQNLERVNAAVKKG